MEALLAIINSDLSSLSQILLSNLLIDAIAIHTVVRKHDCLRPSPNRV